MNRDSSLWREKIKTDITLQLILISWMISHTYKQLRFQRGCRVWTQCRYSLVDEFCAHAKSLSHVAQGEGAVGLQQLTVGLDPHLPHVVTVMWSKEPVLFHLLLYQSCDTKRPLEQTKMAQRKQGFKVTDSQTKKKMFRTQGLEEDGVTAFVERKKVLADRRQTVKDLQDLCSLYYLQKHFSAAITVTVYSIQVSDIIQERSVTQTRHVSAQSTHLFTKVGTFEGDHAHVNRVGDKGLVVHQLI